MSRRWGAGPRRDVLAKAREAGSYLVPVRTPGINFILADFR